MRNAFLLPLAATFCIKLLYSDAQAQRRFIADSLDRYVTSAMQQWQIPGVSIAVIKGDEVLVMKGYGVLEAGKTERVNEHTRFAIGSNTKAFTATAVAKLAAEKKLSLDDKVTRWVPDFKVYDPWITREANLRDLLCHRLGYETFQGDFMFFDSDISYAHLKEKFSKLKPLYGFRSRWGYTNAAFAVAGEVVEKASGQSWGTYLTREIFLPLGMHRTLAYSNQLDTASNIAKAHTVTDGKLIKIPYGRIDNMAPAGSIVSSAYDLSRWAKALLHEGNSNGRNVIPDEAILATRFPHSVLGTGGHQYNRSHFALYGLGWFLQEYENRSLVEHTGGVNGFVTSVTLVPEEKLGIMVLTNTDANGFYEAMKWELLDALLGLPFRDYNKTTFDREKANEEKRNAAIKAKKDTIAMKLPVTLQLGAFTGNYIHDIYGRMNISDSSGKLVARFEHHKGRYAILEPLGGSRFLATFNESLFGIRVWPFTIQDGKVKSVKVTVADFIEFTPYEFFRQ